jgi:outer membrane protein assembly factor BamB
MDDVELVEAEPPGGDPGAAAARRSRASRVLRRWWPLPLALVLAAIAWQAVSGGQERAAAQRLRETPGVIGTTVTPPLGTRAWGATTGVLTGMTPPLDGVVVAADEGADGAGRAVVGIDVATGREVWRVPVREDDATGSEPAGATCGDADGALVWCSFTSVPTFGEASFEAVASLVLVDVTTRTVSETPSLPPASSAVVVGDVAVTASRAGESAVVDGTDLSTGARLWHVDLADPSGQLIGVAPSPAVAVEGDRVRVTGTTATWLLDAADGRAVATAKDLRVLRDGRLVAVEGGSVTRLLGRDGRGTADVDGAPVVVEPDDGTAPGLVFLTRLDGRTGGWLRAVDAGTGVVAWERPAQVDALGRLVLLDGALYGTGRDGLWAADAATGRTLWTTPTGTRAGPALMTDGVSLLRAEHDPQRAGEVVLAAYDLGDGRRRWAEPLPAGVTDVGALGGVLLGSGRGPGPGPAPVYVVE